MRGDVLFYSPRRGNLIEYVIAKATRGKFCHVAIDLGDGSVLEATTRGVQVDIKERQVAAVFSAPLGTEAGIAWLMRQKGRAYGWLDIFDQFLRLTFRTTFYIAQPRGYDCSDLATRYLMAAGVDVGPLADAPHLVTPNDLARQLGVL